MIPASDRRSTVAMATDLFLILLCTVVAIGVEGFSWITPHRWDVSSSASSTSWNRYPPSSLSSALHSTTSPSERTTTAAAVGSAASNVPNFDPQYYQPLAEQFTRNNNLPSRITLTRFLAQYVKDHPEVRSGSRILDLSRPLCMSK